MPVLDGLQAASQLHSGSCRTKIVFLTIHEDQDYVDAVSAAGASGYVTKSHVTSDLVPAIREALVIRTSQSRSNHCASEDAVSIQTIACPDKINKKTGAVQEGGTGVRWERQSYLLPKVKLTPAKYLKLFWLFAMCATWLLLKFVYR